MPASTWRCRPGFSSTTGWRRRSSAGLVPQARVDDAALRLIRQQLRFAAVGDGSTARRSSPATEHRALAREVGDKGHRAAAKREGGATRCCRRRARPARSAARSAGTAPLAVIGRLADVPNTGDHGSSNVTAPYVVTPLEGLQRRPGAAGRGGGPRRRLAAGAGGGACRRRRRGHRCRRLRLPGRGRVHGPVPSPGLQEAPPPPAPQTDPRKPSCRPRGFAAGRAGLLRRAAIAGRSRFTTTRRR